MRKAARSTVGHDVELSRYAAVARLSWLQSGGEIIDGYGGPVRGTLGLSYKFDYRRSY